MNKVVLTIACVVMMSAGAAQAQPLTAGQFLARAEPLMHKSKVALLLSSEARELMRAIGDAGHALRLKLDADRAAGRKVTTCLPPGGKAKIDATELIAYLRALPAAERARSFDSAFAGHVARKYPCPR